MIGRLRGTLVATRPGSVVMDVGGVGYEVAVTSRVLSTLPGVGEEIVLHTHLHVREDALALYGFGSDRDRDLFRLLIGTTGVGPKVAMGLLATLSGDDLRRAVLAENTEALSLAPGVGTRSAQRIILELRPKLADGEATTAGSPVVSQLREALESLGYGASEIRAAVADVDPDGPLPEQLRAALRRLGRDR